MRKTSWGLIVIYEEVQIGINQSKDFEQFMYMFSSTLQVTEFVSSLLLGLNITGLKDELLNEISEFDLRQLVYTIQQLFLPLNIHLFSIH